MLVKKMSYVEIYDGVHLEPTTTFHIDENSYDIVQTNESLMPEKPKNKSYNIINKIKNIFKFK